MVGGVPWWRKTANLAIGSKFLQNRVGAIQGPFDSFPRASRRQTLALRMERHSSNAMKSPAGETARRSRARRLSRSRTAIPQHASRRGR